MSTPSGGHPVRKLLLLALLALAVLGARQALADKGGSYDPAPTT
jgi:MYXO-CTERM domain-containing protein